MTKYKVRISIDEENFIWIIVENGKVINRDACREELVKIRTKENFYNMTNICPICRKENNITDKSILYPKNAFHNVDENGKKIDEWVCYIHYKRNYSHNNPDSTDNLKKRLAHRRTGNLNDHKHILGDNCEDLTDKVFGAKRLGIENDKYNLPYDHYPITKGVSITIGGKLVDLSGKIPQTKGASFTKDIGIRGGWHFGYRIVEYKKLYDIMILWCMSENGMSIEDGYIIPKKIIVLGKSVTIVKNPIRSVKYKQYKITDKELLKKVNDIWQNIVTNSKVLIKI